MGGKSKEWDAYRVMQRYEGIVSDLRSSWMSPVSGVPAGELSMLSRSVSTQVPIRMGESCF